jgi:hypothetical protein
VAGDRGKQDSQRIDMCFYADDSGNHIQDGLMAGVKGDRKTSQEINAVNSTNPD